MGFMREGNASLLLDGKRLLEEADIFCEFQAMYGAVAIYENRLKLDRSCRQLGKLVIMVSTISGNLGNIFEVVLLQQLAEFRFMVTVRRRTLMPA